MRSLVRFQVAPPANETLPKLRRVSFWFSEENRVDTTRPATEVANWPQSEHAQAMKLIRGAISAILLAGTFAAALRIRGTGGTPPQHGGWRPLELPER